MVGPTETPVERFVGMGLMAVGGLIVGASGLCSLGLMGWTVFEWLVELVQSPGPPVDPRIVHRSAFTSMGEVLVNMPFVGGPPVLVGTGLILLGGYVLRRETRVGLATDDPAVFPRIGATDRVLGRFLMGLGSLLLFSTVMLLFALIGDLDARSVHPTSADRQLRDFIERVVITLVPTVFGVTLVLLGLWILRRTRGYGRALSITAGRHE